MQRVIEPLAAPFLLEPINPKLFNKQIHGYYLHGKYDSHNYTLDVYAIIYSDMVKQIQLEGIKIILISEENKVRVLAGDRNILLGNQNMNLVVELIEDNFNVVYKHYLELINDNIGIFDLADIVEISISIVMRYLYTYNLWRIIYKRHANKRLEFAEEDFNNPTTHDIIFYYYQQKYPDCWEKSCSILLGISMENLCIYYKERQQFYNK